MSISLISIKHLDAIHEIDLKTNPSPWSLENLRSSLEVGHQGLVSIKDDKVIGFAMFSVVHPECHILNIAIDKRYQGVGEGSLLLKYVLKQSKAMKVKIIFLEVRVSNKRAINFYESFGFIKDAIREKYYPGNPREDALLMSISI